MELENEEKREQETKEDTERGGVYQIRNRLNNKIYIGSSSNMKKRWYEHKRLLMNGKHENAHMSNFVKKLKNEMDFSLKCLEELFHFSCLEYEDDTEKRLVKEQEYIDVLFDNGNNCYNHSKSVVWKERCFSNDPERTRKRLSIAVRKNLEDPKYREKMTNSIRETVKTERWKSKMLAVQNNKEIRRRQTETKIKNGIIRPFCLKDSFGNVIYIELLSSWSKEKGLQSKRISELRDGIIKLYKGYRLYITPDKLIEEDKKFFAIVRDKSLRYANPPRVISTKFTLQQLLLQKIK